MNVNKLKHYKSLSLRNDARRARIIAPQTENSRSTLADDAGMLKYLFASSDIAGNFIFPHGISIKQLATQDCLHFQ